jgi:predicted RNA-binding protein YlxR (DUF448 family)
MGTTTPVVDTDSGPRTAGANRLCVVTRAVRPVDEMIRFVAGPEGIVPDLKRKLPGRGVWVTGQREAIADAVRRGAFRRSLKSDVTVPPDLPVRVEHLLVRSALDALAVAHKAGLVVAGFAKCEKAITSGRGVVILHASDASAEGSRKLDAAFERRDASANGNIVIIRSFASSELDLALGRSNVVHACVLAGRASETFLARWHELERYRSLDDQTANLTEDNGAPNPAAPQPGME